MLQEVFMYKGDPRLQQQQGEQDEGAEQEHHQRELRLLLCLSDLLRSHLLIGLLWCCGGHVLLATVSHVLHSG